MVKFGDSISINTWLVCATLAIAYRAPNLVYTWWFLALIHIAKVWNDIFCIGWHIKFSRPVINIKIIFNHTLIWELFSPSSNKPIRFLREEKKKNIFWRSFFFLFARGLQIFYVNIFSFCTKPRWPYTQRIKKEDLEHLPPNLFLIKFTDLLAPLHADYP